MKQRVVGMLLTLVVIISFHACTWPVEWPKGEWISEDGSITLNFDDLTGVWSDGEPLRIGNRGSRLYFDKLKDIKPNDPIDGDKRFSGDFDLDKDKLTIYWLRTETSTVFKPIEKSTESTESKE